MNIRIDIPKFPEQTPRRNSGCAADSRVLSLPPRMRTAWRGAKDSSGHSWNATSRSSESRSPPPPCADSGRCWLIITGKSGMHPLLPDPWAFRIKRFAPTWTFSPGPSWSDSYSPGTKISGNGRSRLRRSICEIRGCFTACSACLTHTVSRAIRR